jgi:hypothetical protein
MIPRMYFGAILVWGMRVGRKWVMRCVGYKYCNLYHLIVIVLIRWSRGIFDLQELERGSCALTYDCDRGTKS